MITLFPFQYKTSKLKLFIRICKKALPVGIWFGVDPCSVNKWPLPAVPEEADPTSPVAFAPPTADPYADNAAVVELNDAGWV